jgi:hypothetical protein
MEYRSQKGSWRHVGSDGGGGNRRFLKNGQRNGGGSGGGRHYNRHGQQQNHHSCRGSYWFKGEGYNDHEPLNIEEEVVGINGFKCPEKKGFQGIIKQRFSDFIMNEISSKGQIIQLTSILKKKKTFKQLLLKEFVILHMKRVLQANAKVKAMRGGV